MSKLHIWFFGISYPYNKNRVIYSTPSKKLNDKSLAQILYLAFFFHESQAPGPCCCRLQFGIYLFTPAKACVKNVVPHPGLRPQQHTLFSTRNSSSATSGFQNFPFSIVFHPPASTAYPLSGLNSPCPSCPSW